MDETWDIPISQIGAMTHWPEQPNPVPPIVEAVRRYLQSGDYNPVHEPGTQPADYLRELARNPDIMAKNIEQASQFNFGSTIRPTKGSVPLSKIGNEVPAPQVPPEGITAYHGSPHDFERFDLSKIGTGEGAQAYGHGLYFAENPGVASTYKMEGSTKFIGEEEGQALRALNKANGDREAAAKELRSMAADRRQAGVSGSPTLAQAMAQSYDRSAEMLEKGWQPPKGKMYQVAIKADPEHFLDWDKPLSEQHPEVKQRLKQIGVDPERPGYLAQTMVDDLATKGGAGYASGKGEEALRQAGIPGIKYLDQGSRPAPNQVQLAHELDIHQQILADAQQSGDPRRIADAQSKIKTIQERMAPSRPTSNYVVFDDKTIDILKKYGLIGLFGGAGAGAVSSLPPER